MEAPGIEAIDLEDDDAVAAWELQQAVHEVTAPDIDFAKLRAAQDRRRKARASRETVDLTDDSDLLAELREQIGQLVSSNRKPAGGKGGKGKGRGKGKAPAAAPKALPLWSNPHSMPGALPPSTRSIIYI